MGTLDEYLCQRIKSGKVAPLLGAGASLDCRNTEGTAPPPGDRLAELLANEAHVDYDPFRDSLRTAASVAKKRLGDKEYEIFLKLKYQHCTPSGDYNAIASYNWPRIYTINIDDALETAFRRSNIQRVSVVNRTAPISERNHTIDEIQIIKLNGSVDLIHEGIVFTPEEYTREGLRLGTWYEQLASDYSFYTFVFIGTKLDEPLFYHHVERMISISGSVPGQAYIICPSFTNIQKEVLDASNITPVEGTLHDFVLFLKECMGDKYTSDDVLKFTTPDYVALFADQDMHVKEKVRQQADAITVVARELFGKIPPVHGIREFYFGSVPTWRDVLDNVPANLGVYDEIFDQLKTSVPLIVVHGPAGCGKTTGLMTVSVRIADKRNDKSIFWINKEVYFPKETVKILCSMRDFSPIFFVDDFEWCHEAIRDLIESGYAGNARFIVSERSTAWNRIIGALRKVPKKVVRVERIQERDIPLILQKLETFGPWARLGALSPEQRELAIREKADRQLLVALKEATQGKRYDEILEDEYSRIQGEYEKLAFHISGLSTMHRLKMSYSTFDSAVRLATGKMQFPRDKFLEGILVDHGNSVSLRHSVIADYIIRRIADRNEIFEALKWVLRALTRFDSPVRLYAKNIDYQVYSALINHQFILDIFRGRKEMGLLIYKEFEKSFEKDGLFWLQYALYEFASGKKYRENALNHIRLALSTFPRSFQVIHAYARMHYSFAAEADGPGEARVLMEDASQILEEQITERPNDPYPLVTLARGRINVLRRWFSEDLKGEAATLIARLKEAQKQLPTNHPIRKAIYDIGILASVPEAHQD